MGTFFRTCPNCGANLDPGEICDCTRDTGQDQEDREKRKAEQQRLLIEMSLPWITDLNALAQLRQMAVNYANTDRRD